jgi:hypothetical protein
MGAVQDALPIVIVAVVAAAAIVAVALLARGTGVYDNIRAGDPATRPDPPGARDAEIAQMLAARDARRAARGLAAGGGVTGGGDPAESGPGGSRDPAESGRPIGGGDDAGARPVVPVDDDLRAEVHALVQARNARRVARGEAPIDVEAEVERRLRELDG